MSNLYNLTKENYIDISYEYYQNNYIVTDDEMLEDLDRIVSIKRLIKNYFRKGILNHRLLVTHVVILNNVFDTKYIVELLMFMMPNDEFRAILKTVFLYLGYIKENYNSTLAVNYEIANILRSI